MIEKITMKDVATYDAQGVEIDGFDKINFIYGANGSGKTTISRFLDNLNCAEFSECSVKWENDIPLNIFVYNKDFCNRNFGTSDIEGIFTLGQATTEEMKEIDSLKEELKLVEKSIIANKKSIDSLTELMENTTAEYRDIMWEQYKKNQGIFKEAFKGYLSKDKFFVNVVTLWKKGVKEGTQRNELEEKAKILFGEQPAKKDMLPIILDHRLTEVERMEEWEKHIVGNKDVNISKLIDVLQNADWVNQGRRFLTDDTKCPFCQKDTIDDNFREQLENFFDGEYEDNMNRMKKAYEVYQEEVTVLLEKVRNLCGEKEESLDTEKLKSLYQALERALSLGIKSIEEKLNEPGKSVRIDTVNPIVHEINKLIELANEEISKHNSVIDNYQAERRKLMEDIWNLIVLENRALLESYNKKIEDYQKGLDSVKKQKMDRETKNNQISQQIREKSKNVTSVQPAVDEINRILKNYGFTNFSIVPSPVKANYYQIQRPDGKTAESSLSEGEITFITFLYFLQLIKGSKNEEEVSQERIIVVDDPISSLDSSVLFIVSSLLKDVLNKIGEGGSFVRQAIVLTHNVYFHKEISFDGRGNGSKGGKKYWILRKKNNLSNIQYYNGENPISSSYQLLWKELKEAGKNSCITIQNIMRRIIETYFKILGGYKDETLIEQFPDYESKEICRALISWMNDGSHCLPDDLFVEMQEDSVEKYQEVFKKIFEYTHHIEHYNMMMGENN